MADGNSAEHAPKSKCRFFSPGRMATEVIFRLILIRRRLSEGCKVFKARIKSNAGLDTFNARFAHAIFRNHAMSRCVLSIFALALVCAVNHPVSDAHEADEHDHPRAAPKYPQAMALPAMDGAKPWSDKPVLDDPDRFQIAIMTDHTGGHRPGIWMKAVERLNLLRPAFVMSVGDLIEGYSDDPAAIETQWTEFQAFIDRMQMKFFFVAGNHDVSNSLMHDLWRKHFGAEWYSFDYKGVHFVCLSSEDTKDQIGSKQLAWLEGDLKQHVDARWTLLFFHKPLWTIAERAIAAGNPDTTNWKQVESLLGERPHTVFAGHVHHYVQYDRRGMKYYHLATTGGGSQLRGVAYGEFDHVAWLTMEQDGPTLVNLLLEGIVPANAVTEEGIARFREFLAKTRIEVAPILVDSDEGISSGRIDLRLKNNFDLPIEMTAKIEGLPLRGLTVEPSGLKVTVPAGTTQELSVNVQFDRTITFPHLAETLLTAKVRTLDDPQTLTAERTIPVVIDRKYRCSPAATPMVLDGRLDEWQNLSLTTGDKPLVIGASDQWQGPDDAEVRFAVARDDKFIYVAANVTDDVVMQGDKLDLRFDDRWITNRKADARLRTGTYAIAIAAPLETAPAGESVSEVKVMGKPKVGPASVATIRTKEGWSMEAAIPLEMLTKNQHEKWHSFQFTPILSDVDDVAEKPAQLIWRGTAEANERSTNYGHFVRTK